MGIKVTVETLLLSKEIVHQVYLGERTVIVHLACCFMGWIQKLLMNECSEWFQRICEFFFEEKVFYMISLVSFSTINLMNAQVLLIFMNFLHLST